MARQLRLAIVTIAALAATAGVGSAEQGDGEVGFRLLYVSGSATGSGTLADTGSSPTLDSGPGVELGWALWPLDFLTVELSVGASIHSVETSGGSLGGIDGGTLWRFPLSAVAQYRPEIYGPFDPYFGLGFVYNVTSYDMSAGYEEQFSSGSFSNDLGLVLQAGLDYRLNIRWSANLDIRYMGMDSTGSFTGADGSVDELDFGLDPWVFGLGFRYRY